MTLSSNERGEHTPGPWSVEDPMGCDVGDALWIVAEGATPEVYDWRCVAIVTSDEPNDMDGSASEPISTAERDANARLIAAAPELLEAAINLRDAQRAYMAMRREPGEMREALGQAVAAHAAVLDAALTKAIASEVGHD